MAAPRHTAVSRLARRHTSTFGSLAFISLVAVMILPQRPVVAAYALSFTYYPLYWFAYRYGAVAHDVFKLDAVLLKSVSMAVLAVAYLSTAIVPVSLAVVAVGFVLNMSAARALGADRTYYGHELAGLTYERVTAFPYNWIAHPMLVGNV